MAPPVPIPNTAVKRCSPDGSTAIGRARVGRRQNKSPVGYLNGVFLLFCAASDAARPNAACRQLTDERSLPLSASPNLVLSSRLAQHQTVPVQVIAKLGVHLIIIMERKDAVPCLPRAALTRRNVRAQGIYPGPASIAASSDKCRVRFAALRKTTVAREIAKAECNH